jgi:hypothetical protein
VEIQVKMIPHVVLLYKDIAFSGVTVYWVSEHRGLGLCY